MRSRCNRNILRATEWLLAVALIVLFLPATACSPRIIEHEVVRTDTTLIERHYLDSLFFRDSIYVRETPDTVYHYVERWRDRYVFRTDTLREFVHDTTNVIKTQVVEVDKPLKWWQKGLMGAGAALAVAGLVLLIIGLVKLLKI